ncbi:MAG TPA: AraC family transcriptional regulator [Gammaproteobacteria bacterium]|nr:AraC family transcriptional regulator [Gammaproteobacteria bacterium]
MPRPAYLSSTEIFPTWTAINAKLYQLPPGDVSLPPVPDPCVLVYLSAGQAHVQRNVAGHKNITNINLNAVSMIPAYKPISGRWDTSIEVIHLHVSSEYLADVEALLGIKATHIATLDRFNIRDALIAQIGRQVATLMRLGGMNTSPAYLDSLATLLVTHITHAYCTESADGPAHNDTTSKKTCAFVLDEVIEYIQKNLDGDLRLEQLAAIANLSSFYFLKLFHKTVGKSPHHYILEARVERATQLLQKTSLPVGEIGQRCGFSTPSHFTSAFRQLTGKSPREFRLLQLLAAAFWSVSAFLMAAATSGGMYLASCLAST